MWNTVVWHSSVLHFQNRILSCELGQIFGESRFYYSFPLRPCYFVQCGKLCYFSLRWQKGKNESILLWFPNWVFFLSTTGTEYAISIFFFFSSWQNYHYILALFGFLVKKQHFFEIEICWLLLQFLYFR